MTIHTYRVRRCRIAEESTFATDLTGTMSSFDAINFTVMQASHTYPKQNPQTMRQIMDAQPFDVATEQKRATVTLTINLTGGINGLAGDGDAQTQVMLGRLLRSYTGSQRLGTGDTFTAGASTSSASSVLPVTTVARWATGSVIGVLQADGRIGARYIAGIASSDLTVYPPLAAGDLPANTDDAYNSATYFTGPSAQDDSDNTTLQFALEGLVTHDRYLYLGGKVTNMSFTFTRGQIATVQATIQFCDWKYGEDCATNLTTDTAPLAYTSEAKNGNPVTVHDSDLTALFEDGSFATLDAAAFTFAPQLSWTMIASTAGVNGCAGWARANNARSLTGSLTIPYEDRTWETIRDGYGTANTVNFFFQVGSNAGTNRSGAVLFFISAQIEDVKIVDQDGLTYQTITYHGGVDIPASLADIVDSPFTIGLL